MSFRCINAFAYQDVVYGNGIEVDDGAPILKTHGDHFAEVDRSVLSRAVEQAEAAPGGLRAPTKKAHTAKKPAPKPSEPKSEAPETPAEKE